MKRDSETLLNTSKGVLQVTGDDEEALSGAVKNAAKRLLIADEALEKYAPYRCTAEAYARLEGKVGNLKGEMARLKEQCIRLSEKVSAETIGEEYATELEEKLEESRRILNRLSRKNDVLALISENISWARTQSISGFSAKIEKKMGEIVSSITDGRYSKVKVDGNLEVSVFSKEKGEYIEIDKGTPLSTGTIDQVFLAARLALLDIITGGCKPPLLLDDTFSNFDDMGRKERAFDVLESISGEYQTLYFTCHEVPERVKTICID